VALYLEGGTHPEAGREDCGAMVGTAIGDRSARYSASLPLPRLAKAQANTNSKASSSTTSSHEFEFESEFEWKPS